MPKTKYAKNVVIVTDRQLDGNSELALTNLTAKLGIGPADIYNINNLPTFKDGHFKDARIYLHGHAEWGNGEFDWNSRMGGWEPDALAGALVKANVKDAKVISITGCNTARGFHCQMKVHEIAEEVGAHHPGDHHFQSHIRGIDTHNLFTQYRHDGSYSALGRADVDSRIFGGSDLRQTSEQAITLCMGSFAQRFHRTLMENGVDAPVHARLLPVTIDAFDDGDRRVVGKSTQITYEDDFEGEISICSPSLRKVQNSKIRITARGDGTWDQDFAYVDYARLAADDAALAAQQATAPQPNQASSSSSSSSSSSATGAQGGARQAGVPSQSN